MALTNMKIIKLTIISYGINYSLDDVLRPNVTDVDVKLFNYQKADDKKFVCKFSNNVRSKLYHIKKSKTRRQTVYIWMRLLSMSHLIKIYAVCRFSYMRLRYLKS